MVGIMRRSMAVGILTVCIAALGLGCLKLESEVTVHPNGSASGSVTIGIMEIFWNASEDTDLSFGNLTIIETENATMWVENGWVYFREESETILGENMSVEVIPGEGYTEYVIDTNLTEFEESEDEYNLSDPFSQILLQQMTFKITITMPGEIVEANTEDRSGSMATWTYDGLAIQEADRLLVRSKMYVPEGLFPLVWIPLFSIVLIIRRPRAG